MNSHNVSVAAEALAAAQFARLGFHVSVQYGANQPEHDLIINRENRETGEDITLKISVKGSQDGGWLITGLHVASADYHAAIDSWLSHRSRSTVFCFVQFYKVLFKDLPNMYLATCTDVADWLHTAAAGRGESVLQENHLWAPYVKHAAAGTTDKIPDDWVLSEARIHQILSNREIT